MSDGRVPARRRWIGWTIGAVIALLLIAGGWVAVRGMGAVTELQHVRDYTGQLRSAIGAQDLDQAEAVAPRIQEHASAAHALTSDPVWRGFEFVPWLGVNFTAVREVAAIADSIATDAVEPVLDAAADIDLAGFGLNGGRIDLAPLAQVTAPLAEADETLSEAEGRALRIDADATLPPLADAVREVRDVVTEAATAVGALHGASVLLPPMLGAEGPRTYVVAMQNNAELRSDGGIIGAIALLRAEDGRLSLSRQASTGDFPILDEPLPLSEATTALFDDGPGRYIQNITSIPDFTEAGPIIAERWEQRFGGEVDGVVAVDAVVASHLVAATGPLSFGPFTVDAESVVPTLLSEIYAAVPDPAQQDDVFAQAAAGLLGAALSSGDPQRLIGALATSAEEDRIRIWSAHEDEQALLSASTLSGALPRDDDRGPHVGVLFNDTTGAKMDYYTRAGISTSVGVCQGEPTTRVRITWTNGAPADAAETLPPYVTGDGFFGVDPGDVRTLIAVYGPEGAALAATDRDGADDDVQTALLGTRSVVQHEVLLHPGESATITVDFTGTGAGERLTRVDHTPLIEDPGATREPLVCE